MVFPQTVELRCEPVYCVACLRIGKPAGTMRVHGYLFKKLPATWRAGQIASLSVCERLLSVR
jgi:hypothetical protein